MSDNESSRVNVLVKQSNHPELYEDLVSVDDRPERVRMLATIGLMVVNGHAGLSVGVPSIASEVTGKTTTRDKRAPVESANRPVVVEEKQHDGLSLDNVGDIDDLLTMT